MANPEFLAWQLKKLGTPPMPKVDEVEMLRYGKHLTAITGIGALQSRTDALLVGAFLPLDTMADYSIALLVQEQFRRLWGIYMTVRYPPLVRMAIERRRRRIIVEGGLVTVGFILMGLGIAVMAHLLIPIILPPSYANSLGYMDGLIATLIIGIPGGMIEMYFRTEQNEKRQYQMRLISAFFGVLAPLALIHHWKAYGVIGGRIIANLILSIVGGWLFMKDKGNRISAS